ncbi:MAG: hypothetical protein HY898_18855 [Deltaproteobacteria bacterium]|nr:hypothetical protein [Deltaproteobacteria bacterium]
MRSGPAGQRAFLLPLLLMPLACGSSAGGEQGGAAGGTLEAGADALDAPDSAVGEESSEDASGLDAPEEGDPTPWACRSWDDCADLTVCDFAVGQCEQRDVVPANQIGLYDFKPSAGTEGDVLVVDGCRFFQGFPSVIKVTVGSSALPAVADENRAIITLSSSESGTVGIVGKGGATATGGEFAQSAPGVVACDGTTPAATGLPGASSSHAGPYAAAYVDAAAIKARIYYPSTCGSVRRPPIPGTYPLVTLLHGNGAIYLNYEYLGQYLATWGFVSLMPDEAEENGNSALRLSSNPTLASIWESMRRSWSVCSRPPAPPESSEYAVQMDAN